VVSAIATPNIMSGVANSRLRSAVNSMSSVSQDARVRALRSNAFLPVRSVLEDGRFVIYVDANNNNVLDPGERTMISQLSSTMRVVNASPNPIASMNLGFEGAPVPGLPAFNSRGMPCQIVGAVCADMPGTGYVVYVQQARALGDTGWGAISVTASGRVRAWVWSGTQWN
jgi:Tfp pilus assembly protein FimT